MTPPISASSKPNKVPRLVSLEHRLQHAKDPDGHPVSLIDELFFLLDDPPADTADRWQAGADLCASHGIKTSRMSVWRYYRAHILEWRRAQLPPPPVAPPDPQETARLHEEARNLAARRLIEFLNDPSLSPGHLIGLMQNENNRQQLQLAREQFADRTLVRKQREQRENYERIENRARDKALLPAQMEYLRKTFSTLAAIPPHTTK